ncbi:5-bromo-4-chloroindolyl phosphate hydrolysis family protein [Alphaproteobacteria bacterium KMM 3653]|uniref:5-bromo-4-chloroindolyl phosphate hydrolysis family protein n=1 Tax=Harenicola maris TaxID=2841044 RepID=A0AAP2CR41_9RHOB|nr:5-bromo-4-chloroindolyl phosphate hydrolysis family protein [Harenicola maris]
MAQKFGGKFSPGGETEAPKTKGAQLHPYHGKRAARAGGRVNALFLVPMPLIVVAFLSGPAGLAKSLIALGILLFGAWMTREGVLAHEAYDARKVARRPALPRKIFGSALWGIGLALAGWNAGESLANPVIFGVFGAALHGFAFGLDPMKDKGMEGIDLHQQDRVARAVDAAEGHLAAMADAIKRAQDRGLQSRVEQFSTTARRMFRTVEEDPRDLTAARKFLGVYLKGARDATAKFADIYARNGDAQARADYEALLDDLEQNFTTKTEKLMIDDRSDLDVEIEVLRERLQREGVHLDA